MNFSREFWLDDERNTSQVFPWDSEVSGLDGKAKATHGCIVQRILRPNLYTKDSWVSIESKNYEFESRVQIYRSNYRHLANEYLDHHEETIANKNVDKNMLLSYISLDHDQYYKILTTPKEEDDTLDDE